MSEVHRFLLDGTSKLDLDKKKLAKLRKALNIKRVERVAELFDYILMETKDGIRLWYFEDGLYVLKADGEQVKAAEKKLRNYFENKFKPAISYLFSLGAPTPKVVANIEEEHPVVVSVESTSPQKYKVNARQFGKVYQSIASKDKRIVVFKTKGYIFIAYKKSEKKEVEDLIESQIFFREFKDQLGKYLDIHRTIWEDIAAVKKREHVRITELQEIRSTLDGYLVTVDLISNRLNQMGSFAETRASIAQRSKTEKHLKDLFDYRFEVLLDTLDYMKEIWVMTKNYLGTTDSIVTDLESKATSESIDGLRTITMFTMVAALIGLLVDAQGLLDDVLDLKYTAVLAFLGILAIGAIVDKLFSFYKRNKTHTLEFAERSKDI